MIIEGQLLATGDVSCGEESDPRQTFIQTLDPDWVDDQIGLTLEESVCGGGGMGHYIYENITSIKLLGVRHWHLLEGMGKTN